MRAHHGDLRFDHTADRHFVVALRYPAAPGDQAPG